MKSAEALAHAVERIAQRDAEALGQLYDACSARVLGLARRIVRDHDIAEEITLDVFVQVWHRAADFDRQRGSVLSWLLVMARSRAVDQLRARQRHSAYERVNLVESELVDPTPDPETSSATSQRAVRVRGAVAALPREQRQAIEVAFYGGHSHAEVATLLDQPLGTIKSRIRAGLLALRGRMGQHQSEWA